MEELLVCIDNEADRAVIERYTPGEVKDVESQRGMIRHFLRDWLCTNVPENIGVWGLEVDEFRLLSRDEAMHIAESIVAACQADAGAGKESPHAGARAYLAAIRGRGRDGVEADPPPAQL